MILQEIKGKWSSADTARVYKRCHRRVSGAEWCHIQSLVGFCRFRTFAGDLDEEIRCSLSKFMDGTDVGRKVLREIWIHGLSPAV